MRKAQFLLILFLFVTFVNLAQSNYVKDNFTKYEYYIPMQGGIKLHTAVNVPKDASESNFYPFLMQRTYYSIAFYGENGYSMQVGLSATLMREKYIFIYQDAQRRFRTSYSNSKHLVSVDS